MRRCVAKRQNLKRCPHLRHFAHFLQVEGRDPHATARLADRKALRFQPAESLAHGYVARSKFLGDMVLAQLRARIQLSGHDPVGQDAADAAGNRVFAR